MGMIFGMGCDALPCTGIPRERRKPHWSFCPFTLTLTLSHQGRGDNIATLPLDSGFRRNDGGNLPSRFAAVYY